MLSLGREDSVATAREGRSAMSESSAREDGAGLVRMNAKEGSWPDSFTTKGTKDTKIKPMFVYSPFRVFGLFRG